MEESLTKALVQAPLNVNAAVESYRSVRLSWNGVAEAAHYVVQRSDAYAGPFTEIASPTSASYVDASNIVCGQTYYYRIKAMDASGNESSFSNIVAVTVIPIVPYLLSAVSDSATSIKLTWEKGEGATGYYIFRSVVGAGNYTRIATISSGKTLTYVDTGLTTGQAYSYRIQSYRINAAGVAVASDYSNILTAVPAPAAPKKLRVTGFTYNSLTLAWNAVSGATSYLLMRSDTLNGAFHQVAQTTTTSYTDTYLQSGLTYYYKVAAVVNGIPSDYSAEVSDYPRPIAPSGLTAASKSDTMIKLSWTANANAGYSGYVVEMAEGNSNVFKEVKTVSGMDISTTDISGLTTGQPYIFRIRGYTAVSGGRVVGAPSAQVGCIPKPRIPTGFTVKPLTYASILLQWNSVAMADGYEIYSGTSSAASSMRKIATVTDDGSAKFSYTHNGLTCGTRYYYRIIAYTVNSLGSKVYSSYTSILNTVPIPAAPENAVVASGTSTTAKLNWTPVDGATGYDVILATVAAGPYTQKATINGSSISTLTITGLQTGVNVYMKVRAYRMVGGTKVLGQLSKTLLYKPLPGAVTLKGKSLLLTVAQLQWNAVSGATGYELYSCTSADGTYTLLANVTGATTYKASARAGQTMYYKARAYCTVNGVKSYGPYSAAISLTTVPATTSITAVTSLGEDKLKVMWRQTADIANKSGGYYLYRGESKNTASMSQLAEISRTDILEYVDTGLEMGKVYFYAIRSYAMTDYGIVMGNLSPIASGYTLPGTPTNLTVGQNTATSLSLTWNGVSGSIDGYEVFYATSANGTYKKLGSSLSKAATVTFKTPYILTYNTQYFFKVRAYMNIGSTTVYGTFSSVVSGRTSLGAPTSLSAQSKGNGQIQVSWTGLPDAEGYHIYVSTMPTSNYSFAATVPGTNSSSGVVKNLDVGRQYYFKVAGYRTVNGNQVDGDWSGLCTAVCLPTTPGNLKATVTGYRSVKLTWNAVSGAKYRVYRSVQGTGNYTLAADNLTTNSCTLNDHEVGTNYQYYVKAYVTIENKVVESDASNIVSAKPVLPAPKSIDVSQVGQQVRLTWSKVANASGYIIQRSAVSATSGFATVTLLESVDSLVYSDDMSSLAIGSPTYYRVIPYYRNPETLVRYGGYASKAVSITSKLAAPTNLKAAKQSATSIRLTWNTVSNAHGYYVLRSESANGTYKIIGKVGQFGGFTSSGLTTGKTYYYKVFAYRMVDGKVIKSEYSAYASASLSNTLATPTGLRATRLSATSARLTWTTVPNANGYYILRSDSANGTYKIIGKVGQFGGFTSSGLTTGKTYYYKIFAYRMDGSNVLKSNHTGYVSIKP